MDRLWTWDRPATVREVVDDIARERDIAYTTVMTVMDILFRKGWLTREKDGRAWRYCPTAGREEYTAGLMRDALGESRDRAAALQHFVERMSDEEAEALRTALQRIGGVPGAAADASGPADAAAPR
ncbi:BlaI/MecI/CopY family transcriptional regulator [Yinghuangia sp. KLBMP8922]|uniref:BlaI/MecI/CopY family transcriptional regulator n=2 Tax=Yinghuangia soli TaxID=2908204 RepID=A0AA41Q0B1_9ACTN|nr:BlaI/MecI/CopY family transcriptional regulator [Yinghuangia soli]